MFNPSFISYFNFKMFVLLLAELNYLEKIPLLAEYIYKGLLFINLKVFSSAFKFFCTIICTNLDVFLLVLHRREINKKILTLQNFTKNLVIIRKNSEEQNFKNNFFLYKLRLVFFNLNILFR